MLCTLNTLSYLLVPVWSSLVASIGWRRTYLVMARSILANLALTVPCLHSRASDLGLAPDGITSAAEQWRLEAAKPGCAVEGLGLGDALRQPIFWAYCFANFAQVSYLYSTPLPLPPPTKSSTWCPRTPRSICFTPPPTCFTFSKT